MEEKPHRTREKLKRCLALVEIAKDGKEHQAYHLAHVFGVHVDTISADLLIIKQVLSMMPEYLDKLKIARNLFVRPPAKTRKPRKRKKTGPRKKRPYRDRRPPCIQWLNTVKPVKPAPRAP